MHIVYKKFIDLNPVCVSQGKWVSNTALYLCRTCHKDGANTANRADLRGAVHIPY